MAYQDKIVNILNDKLDVPLAQLESPYWDKPLTGHLFNLSSVDMVYLLFEIEKAFVIRIDPSLLVSYQFSTVNQIAKVIGDCMVT